MKNKKTKIIILIVSLLIVGIVGYYVFNKLFKENKVPEYDLNATWVCSKYNSANTRTYTFDKSGQVRAELDSEPQKNYLLGSYTIESEEIEDSIYTKERDGKFKSYTLNITFDEYVENGVQTSQDSVSWYVDVYNGNYMKLTLPVGSYTCTMK